MGNVGIERPSLSVPPPFSADTDAAREFKRRLLGSPDARAAGLRVWLDKDDLAAGLGWQAQIEKAISEEVPCCGFCVILPWPLHRTQSAATGPQDALLPTATMGAGNARRGLGLEAACVDRGRGLRPLVELLNTAIEKLADRVNLAIDPQIGRVKDMGSAAVGLALLLAAAAWLLALAERLGLI